MPARRRGRASYDKKAPFNIAKIEHLDKEIKKAINRAEDIELRGNPTKAKLPRLAAFLHRNKAKNLAKQSNKLNRERLASKKRK